MAAGLHYRLDLNVLDSYFQWQELSSAPGTPEASNIRLYAKDSSGISTLCYKNDAGTEVCFPTSGTFVTGSGATGHVAFWNSASNIIGESNLFWDATNNFLGVLTATPSEPLDVRGDVRLGSTSSPIDVFWNDTKKDLVLGASAQPGGALDGRGMAIVRTAGVAELDLYGYVGTGTQVGLRLLKPRGGVGSETASQTDDGGFIAFGGHDGSAFVYTGSQILGRSAENWSGTNQGSYLSFHTIALASTTLSERFRIGPSGQLGIGGATYGSSGNVLTSGGSGAAPSWAAPAAQTSTLLDGSVHTDTVAQTVTRGSLVYGNSTPKWDELAVGASAGMFLRTDATDAMWSTLILPNAITANQLVYGSATNTYGASADLTYDGTDLAIASGKRFRMQSQNRTRYLNSMARAYETSAQTINNTTVTVLTFTSESFDTDGLHSTSSNTSRFTAAIAGKYLASSTVSLTSGGVTAELLRVLVNGAGNYAETRDTYTSANTSFLTVMTILSLAANDYVEFAVFHDAGVSITTAPESQTPNGCLAYIGE